MYEGDLVRLRAYRKEDIPLVLEYINDPEVKLNIDIVLPVPLKVEDKQKEYDEIGKDPKQSFSFAIERIEDSKYVGGCGYHQVDWKNSVARVGIFLGKQWSGKGYGADAMRVLAKFIFEEMNMNKIILAVFSFNKRAIGCYKKGGYKTEGVLRQQIFRGGVYHDEILIGLLRGEWREQK